MECYVISLLVGVFFGWMASYLTSRFQSWLNIRKKYRQPGKEVKYFTLSRYAILPVFLFFVIIMFYFTISMGIFMHYDSLDPDTGQFSGGAVSYVEFLLVAIVVAIFSYIVSEISKYVLYRRQLSSHNK